MNLQTVWAVYFSGTGTTEKVVTALATSLSEKLNLPMKTFCFNAPSVRKEELAFTSADLVVFGVPVYAGRVPNLILPYITEQVKGNGAISVPVALFGNRNVDDGLMELRNVMAGNGFTAIAAGSFAAEHSFSTTLGAGRPDGEDMALVEMLAVHTAEKVQSMTEVPTEQIAVVGCDPIRPYYTPRDRNGTPINILKVKPKTDLDRCVKCGLCATLCPMGSINPQDTSDVPGKCIKCCACVKKCPVGAKYYDDEGYLYHQHELEEVYARRAEAEIFC